MVCVMLHGAPAFAGNNVVFDGTVGTAGNAPFNPATQTYTISQDRGILSGKNLFHSFGTFSVDVGETASFTQNPLNPVGTITNVISRVTGGTASNINGNISVAIPSASLWLLNPAGILVGPNAHIDLTGSLALGASDFLVLADGQLLGVQSTEADVGLLVAEPQSFGFLDASAAGDLVLNGTQLVQETSGDLVLQGMNVALDNGATLITRTADTDDAGDIRITAASSITTNIAAGAPVLENAATAIKTESLNATSGSTGAITLGADTVQLAKTEIRSTTASDQAADNVASPIAINGATRLAMTDVDVSSTTSAATASGRIGLGGGAIEINGRLSDFNADGTAAGGVETFTTGTGNAGSIDVTGQSISLVDGAKLTSISGVFQVTRTTGDAGAITLTASDAIVGNQGLPPAEQLRIFSRSRTADAGAVGSVTLTAANIDITNAVVSAETDSSGGGDTSGDGVIDARDRGSVAMVATQALTLTDVQAETNTSRDIDAGDITLSAGGPVTITNPGPVRRIRTATGGAGDAGDIQILGDSIRLSGGIPIVAVTGLRITDPDGTLRPITTTGDAGDITIRATGAIRGNPGVAATAPVLEIESESRTPLSGAAGRVTIEGATVDLTTTRVSASNRSGVLAAPGAVDITAATGLNLTNVDVTTLTTGPSPAGSISIAGGVVDISGVRVNGIDSLTRGSGNAGDVEITGQKITLRDGAEISAGAEDGGGAAGRVKLEGAAIDLRNSSVIATTGSPVAGDTNGDGLINDDDLGSIEIIGSGTVSLRDVNIETTTSNAAHAGNVSVSGGTVSIAQTGVSGLPTIRSATSGAGDAGDVEVVGESISLSGDVEIVAVSGLGGSPEGGSAGSVTLSASGAIEARGPAEDPMVIRSESRTATSGPAGRVTIEGESVDLANTFVIASTKTDRTDGIGAIDITGRRALTLTHTNVATSTEGRASAGDITLSGAAVAITGRLGTVNDDGTPTGGIQATTRGVGNAGNLKITGETIDINDGARLVVTTGPRIDRGGNERPNQQSGDAGNIELMATDALRFNQGFPAAERVEVATASRSPGAGAAGSIALNAPVVDLQLASVAATTDSGRAKDANGDGAINDDDLGSIDIAGSRMLSLKDVNIETTTSRAVPAGHVKLSGGTVSIAQTGVTGLPTIRAATSGAGDAGDVEVVGESISLSGDVEIVAVSGFRQSTQPGSAGSVTLRATGAIEARGAAEDPMLIRTESRTATSGPAGRVTIEGQSVDLSLLSIISTTLTDRTDGVASVAIAGTDRVKLTETDITTRTRGVAPAGDITLTGGVVEITNRLDKFDEFGNPTGGIQTLTNGLGNAGNVQISGESIDLNDGARIVASTGPRIDRNNSVLPEAPTGDGGTVTLTATGAVRTNSGLTNVDLVRIGGASSSVGAGAAGRINIVGDSVDLRATRMTTSTQRAVAGAASTISIQAADDVAFTDVELSASTNGGTDAGHILIEGDSFAMSGGSLESSTIGVGSAGRISIGGSVDDIGNVTSAMVGPIVISEARTDAQNARAAPEGRPRANAGSIEIQSNDLVTVTGTLSSSAGVDAGSAGTIGLVGNGVTLSDALLSTTTASTAVGTPATIRVNGGSGPITLTDSGLEASTSGASGAGDILITGGSFAMTGVKSLANDPDGVGIESSTTGSGNAGRVSIGGAVDGVGNVTQPMAGAFTLSDAKIQTSTSSSGNAGVIQIVAAGDVTLASTGLVQSTGTRSDSLATVATEIGSRSLLPDERAGGAGTIRVSGRSITLSGAQIVADILGGSTGTLPSDIELRSVGPITLTNGAQIRGDTSGAAQGGSIDLATPDTVTLSGVGAQVSSSTIGSWSGRQH